MITLIIGKKGSGKTKKLIDAANAAIEKTNGNVVVIEKESHLTLDISHQARLVALEPYGITGADAFYGFISGICAGNYDVKEIFVDSTLKVIEQKDLEHFVQKLEKLGAFAETAITLSVSMDESELPVGINSIVSCV